MATNGLTITLDPGQSAIIKRRMQEGNFSSPSEYIESLLVLDILPPVPERDPVGRTNMEGSQRLEALKADPSTGLSHEEFWGQLEAEGIFDED